MRWYIAILVGVFSYSLFFSPQWLTDANFPWVTRVSVALADNEDDDDDDDDDERADSKAGRFTGFWGGVDPLDGSGVQNSISDIDQDGVFEIIGRETFFTFCRDVGANGEFGIVLSTGTIGEDGILRVEGTLTCDNDQKIKIKEAYESVKKGAILLLTDPDDAGIPPIILHRLSHP